MPYYKWQGVELTGTIKRGTMFARSLQHLDTLLFKREIALLKSKPVTPSLIKMPIQLRQKMQFFRQLSILVDAGVLLPDALDIVAGQVEHSGLQQVVQELANAVQHGVALSTAMQRYPRVFNQIMVQLTKAGEESGKLPQALEALCGHIEATNDFYLRVRSALLLPGLTFAFFMIIVGIIFTVIVPHFAGIFTSMNMQLPTLTKNVLAISAFMKSSFMVFVVTGIIIAALLVWRLGKGAKSKRIIDACLLAVPFIGAILHKRFIAYVLRSLALLLEGGVHIVPALTMVAASINNSIFKKYITELEADVDAGSSLSDAMARHSQELFSQDVVAMVEVGQESGRLSPILKKAAAAYREKLVRQLSVMTMLLQPIMMIVLGLLVALLIFAVYIPIFELSSGV